MELLWNELGAQRLIYRGTDQAEVEGMLQPPEGKRAAEILDYKAEVSVETCRADEGRLNLDGGITVTVVAAEESGGVFSFTSASAFSHTITAENVDAGMFVDAIPSIASLTVRNTSDERLSLSAIINIDCTVTSSSPIRVLSGVSGIADLEMKSSELKTARRVELSNETIRLSEEIASEGADKVLKYSARISVRDTAFENGGASISGAVTLNALCMSAEGELMQLTRSIPFRENIELNGSADEIYATAELSRVSVRALGTEFSLIAFDADAEFRVYGMRRGGLSMPLDAFSPSINFNCIRENLHLTNSVGGSGMQHSLRENISVPEGLPDIFTAHYASAASVVTSVAFNNGEMTVEGLLITRLIYRSSGGRLYSFTEDVPFSIGMAAPRESSYAKLRTGCTANVTGGGGRTAQIAYSIDATAEFFGETKVSAVVGIAECEAEPTLSGIVIYNAAAGETVFDVAKRFRLPSARVSELNPNIGETLADGDKVLLMV